jgi:glutathione S-transferase
MVIVAIWETLMLLIGRYASPFVRRVAVTLQHYDIAYEHHSVMPFGADKPVLAKLNPIARVPILQISDDEYLWDSPAILDYLDQMVGSERALVPAQGEARRQVNRLLATALGANEKLVTALYERHFRPKELWHPPWIEACENQVRDGYLWLQEQFIGPYFLGPEISQADLTVAVFWNFGMGKRPGIFAKIDCPQLRALAGQLEKTAAFQQTQPEAEKLSSQLEG